MNVILYLICGSLAADVIYAFYLIGRPRKQVTFLLAFVVLVTHALFIVALVTAAGRLR